VQELLSERRLAEAHDLLPAIEDPLAAERALAELWYLGRDFKASFDAAERGLALAPGDLLLLHRALGAALWLRDGERAAAVARRLEETVAGAALGADERAWWEETVRRLGADAQALVAADAERSARAARARRTCGVLLGGVLLGLVVLARR
jgi:hypothetical protein